MRRNPGTLSASILIVILGTTHSAHAQDHNFPVDTNLSIINFDLSSVQQLQPGRFVISVLTLDKPEIMRMRIAATREMYKFCLKDAGLYPPIPAMYGIGPPDLPVNNLEVRVTFDGVGPQRKAYKDVSWKYPYKRSASCNDEHCVSVREYVDLVNCQSTQKENDDKFSAWWSVEMNGIKS